MECQRRLAGRLLAPVPGVKGGNPRAGNPR